MIKNIKNTVPWIFVVSDLNGDKIVVTKLLKHFMKIAKIKSRRV